MGKDRLHNHRAPFNIFKQKSTLQTFLYKTYIKACSKFRFLNKQLLTKNLFKVNNVKIQ